MTPNLQSLNAAPPGEALAMLQGLYEHSPWIAEKALQARPFRSLAELKHHMARLLQQSGPQAQLALVRAHPELAGKAMVEDTLTDDSRQEQQQAGLTRCTPQELAQIASLNAAYAARFGFPFILAIRGPRGTGLSKQQILATFERRLENHPEFELQEALRQINRIVELRLNDRFGCQPRLGNEVWDWHEQLAAFSDPPYAEHGQLTVTYLTEAHRACARQLQARMLECGCDEATIDAVGNVVGRYHADATRHGGARTLLTGSHYDTVRNAGKYDGRLGIFVPLACVRELKHTGRRLAFALEVVAFAEEEGQRYGATFLGSSALVNEFDPRWLEQVDADGVTMREAMERSGLDVGAIAQLARDPRQYLGFVEVHIEQGPVLATLQLPLAVVTSINGSVRCTVELRGTACHSGTTPMGQRSDAAAAAAEVVLAVERRAAQDRDSVATVGQLQVPDGSPNVVPGRCVFTLDMRAPTDAQRDALVGDIRAKLEQICARRQVHCAVAETMRASAAPSNPVWQQRWERALDTLGVPLHRMASGAGHDAMKLHRAMPQAMLFVRGENAGISHNPLESTTSDDMDLAVRACLTLLEQVDQELRKP